MPNNFSPSKIRYSKYYIEKLLDKEKSLLPKDKEIKEEKKPKSIINRLFGWILNN